MPHSIPKGLNREAVLQALADLDAGVEHPFGPPTGYELVREGRRYPPKAGVGLAARALLGRILSPDEFSGGEAPGQANFVLRELGFFIEEKGAEPPRGDRRDWSRDEVDLIVSSYFLMLRAELAGEPYSKSDRNRELRSLLDGRTKSSVEFKHQNISAVLAGMGLPYIVGYKPARNYQKAVLPQAIEDYLIRNPKLLEVLAEGRILNPTSTPEVPDRSVEAYFEDPPESIPLPRGEVRPWLSRRGSRVDFARRDATNRTLGRLGEEFTMAVEKRRLLAIGRDDLAARVEWVSQTCGDGLGFDVLSFEERDDSERYIEVKTTGMGKLAPFYATAIEVRCSEDCPDRFRLYRVFDFARDPRLYVVPGSLSRACRLEPVAYRVTL